MLQRTNIYLEPETIRFFKQKAKEKGTTMAEELRTTLQKDMKAKQKNWKESMQSMIKNAGKGPADLAENHDSYLYK